MYMLAPRKRHDTAYSLVVELSDVNGPRDLTDALYVKLTMVNAKTGAVKINAATCTILDQVLKPGQVQYDWTSANVDTSATFRLEWEVTFTNARKATWPSGDYAQLVIKDDLDNA